MQWEFQGNMIQGPGVPSFIFRQSRAVYHHVLGLPGKRLGPSGQPRLRCARRGGASLSSAVCLGLSAVYQGFRA